jgi:CubicO group peptidase (beta-lactamase class C family)
VKTRVVPTERFSVPRLERLADTLGGYVDRGDLAGVAARVYHNGSIVLAKVCGWADKESGRQMEDDTIFMIASMTKPITAAAMMMLYEEGHFDLNTPVREFIPAFKDLRVCTGANADGTLSLAALDRDITIRHLFTHTSGIGAGFGESDAVALEYRKLQQRYKAGKVQMTMATVSEDICSLPLASQPGTKVRYGDSSQVIGMLVEIISGQRFDAFLEQRVFRPLAMTDTAFYVPTEKSARVARVYGRSDPGQALQPRVDTRPPQEPPGFPSPAGGLVSTADDYARFCLMLLNGGQLDGVRLLSPTTVAMFSMNHTPEEALRYLSTKGGLPGYGYGFGLSCRVLMNLSDSGSYGSEGEFGWFGSLTTSFWVDPRESLCGILLSQHSPMHAPIFQQFHQLTYQAMV